MRNHGRKVRVNSNTVMVANVGRRPRRQRNRIYDQKEKTFSPYYS